MTSASPERNDSPYVQAFPRPAPSVHSARMREDPPRATRILPQRSGPQAQLTAGASSPDPFCGRRRRCQGLSEEGWVTHVHLYEPPRLAVSSSQRPSQTETGWPLSAWGSALL